MALRGLGLLALFFLGSVAAVGCGGASDNDFNSDDGSAGDSAGEGNGGSSQGGASQGGSSQGGASQGGSSQGGASGTGGSGQGGSAPNGGSSTGGAPSGGASGKETGGATTGGTGGMGGEGGGLGGTGSPSGGSGGATDCARIIAEAQAALASAQVCDPNTDGPKCTGKVEDLCGCVVPVNDADSALTHTYLELREAAIECNPACLAIVCPEPTAVMCGIGGATTNIIGVRSQCRYSPR